MARKKVSRKLKSARQIRFLFSAGSPLSAAEQQKLRGEIRRGTIKVKGGKSEIGKKPSKAVTRKRIAALRKKKR